MPQPRNDKFFPSVNVEQKWPDAKERPNETKTKRERPAKLYPRILIAETTGHHSGRCKATTIIAIGDPYASDTTTCRRETLEHMISMPRVPRSRRAKLTSFLGRDRWSDLGLRCVWFYSFRRMFPTLALSVLGMDPRKNYAIHVDIVPVDGFSYTFVNNQWQVNGIASEMHAFPYVQSFQADEVARSGQYWMKNGIDFKKVRLTNRRTGAFKDGEVRWRDCSPTTHQTCYLTTHHAQGMTSWFSLNLPKLSSVETRAQFILQK